MIDKDSFNKKKKTRILPNLLFNMLIKTLLVIILFLSSMIYIRFDSDNKEKFKTIIYNNSISFAKLYNVYEKYFGDVIPFKNIFKNNTRLVGNGKLVYSNITKKGNGYILDVSKDYTVTSLRSGIIINIKKEDDNTITITIQDKEGVNITYGNLKNKNVSLYDFVIKDDIIGSTNNKLYLEFKKGKEYLNYEKYL